MCYNSENTIVETIKSYESIADKITLCIDLKTSDNTVKLIKEIDLKKIKIHYIKFTDFSEARNKCLDLAGNEYTWTMFIDDSYIIIRPENLLKSLKDIPVGIKASSINICTGPNTYKSIRIFKSIHNIRYTGKVHEVPMVANEWFIDTCYIYDKQCPTQKIRTDDRLYNDINVLGDTDPTPHSLFLFANCIFQLFHEDLEKIDIVIDAYNKRCSLPHDPEERFMSYLCMGHLFLKKGILIGDRNTYKSIAIRSYLSGALIYEPRAGECYYYIYLLTNNIHYLKKAYENRIIGPHRLNVDFRVYSNYHVGEIEQCYNSTVLDQKFS